MGENGFDPRVVANFILEARELIGLPTTKIELQKLLYFSHESYLIQNRARLVAGYFEAWSFGPVHPDVFIAFRHIDGRYISGRATARNVLTGGAVALPSLADTSAKRHITETVAKLSGLSASELVKLSHIPGGPWHRVVEAYKSSVALGLRITDDAILTYRTHSMLMRGGQPAVDLRSVHSLGVLPDDESPLAGYGYG